MPDEGNAIAALEHTNCVGYLKLDLCHSFP
jgi:hypothetical protein